MPPNPIEASAALLVRVWTEPGDPGALGFRILASTAGQPTSVVARGHGHGQLLDAVRDWLEHVAMNGDAAATVEDG